MNKQSNLYCIRHSAAHILGQAVQRLFKNARVVIGPVTEHGFFQDIMCPDQISESDLPAIEKEMHKIVQENLSIEGKRYSKEEAKKIYHDHPFKLEIIDRIPEPEVSIYTQGEYFDLCEGNHTDTTGGVQFFKLTHISGSYWRGNKDNAQLQRIFGVAFESQSDIDLYFERLELAKQYDHRLIGKKLDLFSFQDEAQGMPFFHNNGMVIYNQLISFIREKLRKYKYQEIRTPLVLDEKLWHISGHYAHYKENMFFCQTNEEKFAVKPMSCPCAALVYKNGFYSYRDLPLRLAEFGHVHRYELSGALHGLFRVRSFTQDDAHIFCTINQITQEVQSCLALAKEVYERFSFDKVKMALSTRPEKFMGSESDWEQATESLRTALDSQSIAYTINEGDGAFYGPKIDMYIEDALGRQWQCGTIQVDFSLAARFELTYVNHDQSRQTPVVVHRALLGSIERFMAILLEHCKGKVPFWLAPVQAVVMNIVDDQADYAREIEEKLTNLGLRVETDLSSDKISAKIKKAQLSWIPWMVIVGKKEKIEQTITIRKLDGSQLTDQKIENIKELVNQLNS